MNRNNKRIVNNNNSSCNKKQRLENNSNNNSGVDNNISEYEVFMNRNYDDIKYSELKEYGISLGIKVGRSKVDAYERIKQHLQTQEKENKENVMIEGIDTLKVKDNQEKELLDNSINKDQIEGLVIKHDGELEKMFWKVIKNQYIFKKIFSNFKFSRSFNYERLYEVDYILENYTNGKEILLDKMKSGAYLVINAVSFSREFNKDTSQNRVIIHQLITSERYSKSFSTLKLAREAIENSSVVLLKMLNVNKEMIEQIIDISSLDIYIGSYGDFKMIEYLNKSLGFDTCTNKIVTSQKNKLSNSGKTHRVFSVNQNSFTRTKYRINRVETRFRIRFYGVNIFKQSVKHFIKSIEILPLVFNDLSKEQIKLIESLDTNLSTLFTPEQLKLSINQLLDQYSAIIVNNINDCNNRNKNNNSIKLALLKYIDLYYSTTGNSKPFDYYLLFKDEKTIKAELDTTQNSVLKRLLRIAKQFKINSKIIIDFIKSSFSNKRELMGLVFSSGIIELIDALLKSSLIPIYFLKVSKDDHDDSDNGFCKLIVESIKSTTVLNYFYEKHQNFKLFKDGNDYCYYVRNLTILKHYEELMLRLGRNFNINNKFPNIYNSQPFIVFDRALNGNPSAYKIDYNEIDELDFFDYYLVRAIKDLGSPELNKLSVQVLNSFLFKLSNKPSQSISEISPYGMDSIKTIPDHFNKELLIWLFESLVVDPISNEIIVRKSNKTTEYNTTVSVNINSEGYNSKSMVIEFGMEFPIFSELFYIFGKYEQISTIGGSQLHLDLLKDSKLQLSVEFIDQVLHNILVSKSIQLSSKDLFNFIIECVYDSNLAVLKLITSKYKQLFTEKSASNTDGIFEIQDLNKLLSKAIICDSYEISLLLSSFIQITKTQFTLIEKKPFSIVKDHLINHFK